ncbi:MAG: hypothetical protein V1870_03535 [Candidatus Aenigmatarchaeota archaeon]
MKKLELVYKEILDSRIEKSMTRFTQAEISRKLHISLSTVNHALIPLKNMGAIKISIRFFDVTDAKKILYYWASIRNIEKDIIYKTRVDADVTDIEKKMSNDAVFAVYSAYKFIFKSMPADYSEVYVYASDITEIKRRFPENKNVSNLFVINGDLKRMSMSHLFVDIWNMKEWYAKEFLKELEARIDGLLA